MEQIPTIFDYLRYLEFLRGYPAVYIVIITAAVIFVVRDWRISLLALMIQYLTVGLLFADALDARLAFMKVLVGLFICIILYITARQVHWGKLPDDVSAEEAVHLRQERLVRFGPYVLPTNTPFRVLLALMVILAMWALAQRSAFHLPLVPDHLNLAIYSLVGLGIVGMSLTTEPLKAGMNLLTLFIGFELFYSALDQSVAMLALLAAANLTVAMVMAYLVQARHAISALLD